MDINQKIKEIKQRIKNLTSHFPYSDTEINILTICYIAIASIDYEITDILDEVFSRVFILFNNGEFNKLIKKVDGKEALGYGGLHVCRTSDDYEYIYINLFNIAYRDHYTTLMFDIIIHEIKHAMNCTIKRRITRYGKEKDYSGLNGKPYGDAILDEAFNCYITRVYLTQIEELKKMNIKNRGIRAILNDFYTNFYKIPQSYRAANILRNLFRDEKYFRLFYNASLYRDLDPLYDELSKLLEMSPVETEYLLKDYLDEYDMVGHMTSSLEPLINKINANCPQRVLKIKSDFSSI